MTKSESSPKLEASTVKNSGSRLACHPRCSHWQKNRRQTGDQAVLPRRSRAGFRISDITARFIILPVSLTLAIIALAQDGIPLAGTQPLTLQGSLSVQMVAGIDKFLAREIERSVAGREGFWKRDFSSPQAYEKSVAPNRERFRKMIGALDERLPATALEFVSSTDSPAKIAETEFFTVYAVRWLVFDNVFGEGLWLRPKTTPVAHVVAIPDADQTPEMLVGLSPGLKPDRQFARRLAEHGCEVLVPVLINRDDTWSGNPAINKFTNQPHREWIYRQAFQLGRHIVGYEVQKTLAAVDWFANQSAIGSRQSAIGQEQSLLASSHTPIGVAGYGEGGLIAFYAAALDSRIQASLVSGYFDSRQRIWAEPVYRNVFGLLREFGDAEIASLLAPRALVIEHSEVPKVDGPPKPREGRAGAAPGKLITPAYDSVEAEFEHTRSLFKDGDPKIFDHFKLITGTEGMTTGPVSDRALVALLQALGQSVERVKPPGQAPEDLRKQFDAAERQHRQVDELVHHTQKIFRESERMRKEFFWKNLKTDSTEALVASTKPLRDYYREQIIGVLTNATRPPNSRSHKIMETPKWTGYEVMLDVFPDVFAWGYLLLPKDLKPGERRPAVVCQHGLEGTPEDVVLDNPRSGAFGIYKAFAARLADRGFVVFAPHNPYRGDDSFRQLQRKANPLGTSLFAIITAQHSRILDWLGEQPFVDSSRIGFYGLSYGGNTAMHVPPLLDRYALSICSASFNEWTHKVVAVDFPASYMFVMEYEMFEFNLGNTFGHAEMAALIAPRPFMVERGHRDPVGTDEWVSYEYAKVQRLYDQLGIGSKTEVEFFDGGHMINGAGTFDFLHQHLNWPRPEH